MDKIYYIFAGVNGAGKSTLYNANKDKNIGERINVDEILHDFHGDWKNSEDQMKALVMALRKIEKCLDEGITFNHETLLTGNSYDFIKNIKDKGFKVYLHYVGLDSPDIAIKRVEARVKNGGHGIKEEDIIRRYNESIENLKLVLPLCEQIYLYDNSGANFKATAKGENGKITTILYKCKWLQEVLGI